MTPGPKLGLGHQVWAQECWEEGNSWERPGMWIPKISEKMEEKADVCLRARWAACRKGPM